MASLLQQLWTHHPGACLVLIATVVLGCAWLRVLWGHGPGARHRAPTHWYACYTPPELRLPCKWSLRDLNHEYIVERPADSPEAAGDDSA